MEPIFLTFDEVLEIHRDQIERYGGETGVRDIGLLQSAVAMPKSRFSGGYLHQDLHDMAAAYLFHIVQNHPFLDGNKRTGAVAAIVFLDINAIDVEVEEEDLESLVISVASGSAEKDAVARFFRERS